MSRLTSDKNLQQRQPNDQNQEIVQPIQQHQQRQPFQIIRTPATQYQSSSNLTATESISIINNSVTLVANNDILHGPSNVNSNSIYYPNQSVSTSLANSNLSINVAPSNQQLNSQSYIDTTSSIAKKRLKLEVNDNLNSSESSDTTENLSTLRKKILEHKLQRLKVLKERNADNVAELFFLQSSGNMMEFQTWRRKPQSQSFLSFKRNSHLDPTLLDDVDSFRTLNSQQFPEGAEIKIPGVGSTPIAVSTQLPPAVAKLSQKGGTPLVPDQKRILSVNSIIGSIKNTSSDLSSLKTSETVSLSAQQISNDQFSLKAKEEVHVLQRVQELKREGLWMGARLPKLAEPQRYKVHWDFLLEEMQWLATDFANERKWKKAAAKRCARMVQKYFQDKETAVQKAEKAQEQNLKRIAAFVAKEIKTFWANVEKVVEFKQQVRLEAKRKKALNEKLNFIVDQTEKFSMQVAEGMNKNVHLSSKKSSVVQHASDDEWSRPNEESDDDEETIAQAESEIPVSGTNDEIEALQKESQMNFNDFLQTLPKDYLQKRNEIVVPDSSSASEEESDKEFEASEDEEDDEHTIMEQEKAEKNEDYQAEIDELKAEGEMSVDELLAKYKNKSPNVDEATDSDDEFDSEESYSSESEDEHMEVDNYKQMEGLTGEEADREGFDLRNLLEDQETTSTDSNCDNGNTLLNNVAALAQSIQPKGNTLSSTNVVTPIPFLLKHTLREYQHIGLDWLFTMHDRKLNGILADEMGLGKTIQTIALLAHLACVRGNWGPHLIVVPSSVMLNWEMEFKKWCPGFKIITYYGSQKERKLKRIGWTKANAFHVCITSYKLVIQDHQSFRRKKWKYLILDEAQNIKNFKSQRWQLLLNFSTQQRLLLTGTPLQNNLMELWSLMHFLMPNFFESHRAFEELFSKPMTGMVEGNMEYNETIIIKLHKVLRPFLLRRLKSEVEKQMPKKYEHVVMCRLSKRQRFLYDDFMSRAKTKETLASGNLLSVINVLMQLRKVCNHPNLFEVRPTISPFQMDQIDFKIPAMLYNIVQYDPFKNIDLNALNLLLIRLESCLSAFVAYRIKNLITPKKLIEEIDSAPEIPPVCPEKKYKLHLRIKPQIQSNIVTSIGPEIKVGTSPAIRSDGSRLILIQERKLNQVGGNSTPMIIDEEKPTVSSFQMPSGASLNLRSKPTHQLFQCPSGQIYIVNNKPNVLPKSGMMVVNQTQQSTPTVAQPIASAVIEAVRKKSLVPINIVSEERTQLSEFHLSDIHELQQEYRFQILQLLSKINRRKCDAVPMYGEDVRSSVFLDFSEKINRESDAFIVKSFGNVNRCKSNGNVWSLERTIKSIEERASELNEIFEKFTFVVPAVSACRPSLSVSHMNPSERNEEEFRDAKISKELAPKTTLLHTIQSSMTTQFPDPRLIQYDCGKLQSLDILLRRLKSESHRVLIFTQMTKMLDVLEAFLNYHGHIYLRLDGTTKVEQRQLLMERFNEDKRIFAFILSTRSGGVGINLTGADTVIFYDSDWNPTCDAQAQDRCHRIGQTRDVHIYRLISEKTIEENILKKANQKRLLGDLAIEGGNFTEAYFKSSTIQDLFNVDQNDDVTARLTNVVDRDKDRNEKSSSNNEHDKNVVCVFESALAQAEDDQDVQAATTAKEEMAEDLAEFDENIPIIEEQKTEQTKQEKEIQSIVEQLSPIERYAMKFVEDTGANWAAVQIKAVEMEIEEQKRKWEEKRLAHNYQNEQEKEQMEKDDEECLTYSRKDAMNKVWISNNTMKQMPMWCPPTPPQDGNDIYTDYSLSFLYDTQNVMNDSQLPAVYVRKDCKRMRTDDNFFMDGRRSLKMRKDDGYNPPRSLFDRPSPAIAKMRKDLKLQRTRGLIRSMPMVNIKQHIPIKPLTEPEGMAEWLIFEDRAILNVIQSLQGLPLNLMIISPGHTPNWDLVADIVNQTSRTYRSPKQCRWRYEAVIVPREEGKLIDSPKKQKKNKNLLKTVMKNTRTPRTSQLYQNDNNNSFIRLTKLKFDAVKTAMTKKQPQLKKYVGTTAHNQKHLSVLHEIGIVNYDSPPSPMDIAHRCYERLVQDRSLAQQKMEHQVKIQTTKLTLMADQLPSSLQMQQQTASIPSPQSSQMTPLQQATIVVQPSGSCPQGVVTTPTSQPQAAQQSITALMHSSPLQTQRIQTQTINLTPSQNSSQQQQLMKAIVASPGGGHQQATLLTGIIQQLNPQQIQNSQSNLIQTSSVSVVLASPPSTVTSVQPQIVSIQPTVSMAASTSIVTQPGGSLVQAINSQGQNQVVSVSQLAIGSTSLTTQASPVGTQAQVRQRSVSKEVVFQHRPGSQTPTVISLSGLSGQGLTNLQNATLRFTSNFSPPNFRAAATDKQQLVTQGAKRFELVTTGTPQFHIYGQQQVRQKIRFLHAGQLTQAGATNQTTLVPSSGVGQTVQVQSGQKITVATISGSNTSQPQAQASQVITAAEGVDSTASGIGNVTVQGGPQQRAQFIKQIGTAQAIGQNSNQKLVMVKHELPQQYKTGQLQLTTQTQLGYTPAGNLQLQQASGSTSGQQQITTLIKTSSNSGITTVAGAGQIGMKLTPVRASIGQTQTVRQVAIPQAMTMNIQGPRKTVPKVTRIAQVAARGGLLFQQKDEGGKVTLQEVKPIKTQNQIFLSNPSSVIPVTVSQSSNSRGETLQFVSPTTRGIPTSNIRFQQAMQKMLASNENPSTIALSQVIGQRRLQAVTVQKPQSNIQQQIAIDGNVNPTSTQQQLQTSSSPSQQTTSQPQHSP
ncbi:CLUMA_CG020304, isoform A [Clunio marinus]|uniref:CLUMA_CG020304, isoform A n=1 Tax=Clunio marinus TaxID=568069 RepID=A0A1J1J4I9_9DIPT|nr:CLUMA_CG020304, isoform A [Clunio marinus]